MAISLFDIRFAASVGAGQITPYPNQNLRMKKAAI
jgi:hypothetical protein